MADLLVDPALSSRPSADQLFLSLRTALDRHALVTRRLILNRPPSPWYSAVGPELLELKRERRRAKRKWRATNLHVDRQVFQAAKNRVTSLVQRAKSLYFSSEILTCTTSKQLLSVTVLTSKQFFSVTHSLNI